MGFFSKLFRKKPKAEAPVASPSTSSVQGGPASLDMEDVYLKQFPRNSVVLAPAPCGDGCVCVSVFVAYVCRQSCVCVCVAVDGCVSLGVFTCTDGCPQVCVCVCVHVSVEDSATPTLKRLRSEHSHHGSWVSMVLQVHLSQRNPDDISFHHPHRSTEHNLHHCAHRVMTQDRKLHCECLWIGMCVCVWPHSTGDSTVGACG